MSHDVVIVGAGISGLACARHLMQAGFKPLLLEASDAVGGRIRTDKVEGFLLDRGFQVLLTSYPEAKRILDFPALHLKPFLPGAIVRFNGAFHELADPWRRPLAGLRSLASPIGTFADKCRIARFRARCVKASSDPQVKANTKTSLDALREFGFSPMIIERFFRPFLGGVFLERELKTPDSMLQFVFGMFATGQACLPASGMQAIPQQLVASLPPDCLRLKARVQQIDNYFARLESGEIFSGKPIVVACEGDSMTQLLVHDLYSTTEPSRGVTCLYFTASASPLRHPILVLNGDGRGPINNLCVPTLTSPSYGPNDRHLVSVTVLGASHDPKSILKEVEQQLFEWYGASSKAWQHLRTYSIPYALPTNSILEKAGAEEAVRHSPGIYLCGDHFGNASIQGALASGRRAAQAVIEDRSQHQ